MKKLTPLFLFFIFPTLFCMEKKTKKHKNNQQLSQQKSKKKQPPKKISAQLKILDLHQEGLTQFVNTKADQLYSLEDQVGKIDVDLTSLFNRLEDEIQQRQRLDEIVYNQAAVIAKLSEHCNSNVNTPNSE